MSDLELMVDELKAKEQKLINEIEKKEVQHSYVIYKRSLPEGLNKVIAQNLPTYEDGLKICKVMKFKIHEENDNGNTRIVYYEILPDTKEYKDFTYNDCAASTVGNDKKKASLLYFGLED